MPSNTPHPFLTALQNANSEGIKTENGDLGVVQLEEFARHDALSDPARDGNRALPMFWNICLHRGGKVTTFIAQRQQNEIGDAFGRRSDKAASKSLLSVLTRTLSAHLYS